MGKALEALSIIQSELKAPKNLYNSFGKYKYRNFEGICEAVKPLLKKTNTTLVLSDFIENIGDRYYIVAKATFASLEDDTFIEVQAMARESFDKKGMDESQITGTASSYARKYCLNGLFLLDDTKDADTDEYHKQTHQESKETKEIKKAATNPNELISEERVMTLLKQCDKEGISEDEVCEKQDIESFRKMTLTQNAVMSNNWSRIVDELKKSKAEKADESAVRQMIDETEGIPFA